MNCIAPPQAGVCRKIELYSVSPAALSKTLRRGIANHKRRCDEVMRGRGRVWRYGVELRVNS